MDRNNRSAASRFVSSPGVAALVSDLDMRLIKMLLILYRAKDGLNTRALLREYQSIGQGQELLKDLVKKGFVRRSEVKREDKKGRGGTHVTMNYITDEGTRYLKNLIDV